MDANAVVSVVLILIVCASLAVSAMRKKKPRDEAQKGEQPPTILDDMGVDATSPSTPRPPWAFRCCTPSPAGEAAAARS